jgi:hypothetical protein
MSAVTPEREQIVAEEPGLGEHEGEERGAGQLPPRVAQQEERGPAGGEQQRVGGDLGGVVGGAAVRAARPA